MAPLNKLDALAQRSIETCLGRLSRISTGVWRAAMVISYQGKPRDVLARYSPGTSEAVFLKLEGLPLAALMMVSPGDVECLTRGFTGHSFPATGKISKGDEIMLGELGNILLNSLLNSIVNSLQNEALPGLPRFHEGDGAKLAEALAGQLNVDEECRVISAALSLQCEGLASWTIHAFLPEELAKKTEQQQ